MVQNDPPAVLKPPELDENFIEQDDDLMGFGLDFEDIVDNNTMKNISAWDSISLTPVDSVGTNTVESWSDAAEERRSQQKLSANMEFHRVSQLVM